VRWGLTLREMWRSLEMVMSSFDEAKFSAGDFEQPCAAGRG
jgi:hypothetical protein